MIEENVKALEDFSEKFLKGEIKRDTIKEVVLDRVHLIKAYNDIIKEKHYEIIDNKTIKEAVNKAKDDIMGYIQDVNFKIDGLKASKSQYENQQYTIDEHNRNIRWEIHTRKDKLHRLGLFDRAEKKRLQAEIDSFKEEPYPMDYDSKIKGLEGDIKHLTESLEPYYELIKGLNYYESEAERYFMTQEFERLKEKQNRPKTQTATKTAPQKPKKAPIKPANIKDYKEPKEIKKPRLKPIKPL
jgi:hypothetical protein